MKFDVVFKMIFMKMLTKNLSHQIQTLREPIFKLVFIQKLPYYTNQLPFDRNYGYYEEANSNRTI